MSERVFKFRTPTKCQNGHFRWYYYEPHYGHWKDVSWGPKNCDCPTGDFTEGFAQCGPDQQVTDFVDNLGVEIFESDLLYYPIGIQLIDEHVWPHKEWIVTPEERRMEVIWENGSWRILDCCRGKTILMAVANLKEMTVCGNIYEHPAFHGCCISSPHAGPRCDAEKTGS